MARWRWPGATAWCVSRHAFLPTRCGSPTGRSALVSCDGACMKTQAKMQAFEISPLGPYSLQESALFIDGWHQAPADGGTSHGHLHLAFLTDREHRPVAVCLRQNDAGAVVGDVYGTVATTKVKNQVARILSLDVDGRGWPEVARRDRVVALLQRRFPGFRPVNWSDAYEAAAWCLISTRINMRQAQARAEAAGRDTDRIRPRLSSESGRAGGLGGELAAVPDVGGGVPAPDPGGRGGNDALASLRVILAS